MGAAYEIVGDLKRFDAENTVFRRAQWDETCLVYGVKHKSVEEVIALGKPGYAREDFAFHAGAWAMSPGSYRACQEHFVGHDDMEAAEYAATQTGETSHPDEMTRNVKAAARFYGAALVGVTRVNPLWGYAEAAELPATCVVMAVDMDRDLVATSPAVAAAAATGQGYSRMAFVAMCLACYLNHLGWRATACGNDSALSIPLAVDAGLGELGRNGLLITREFGPCVRLCKVFTDAPLVADAPADFGVAETCRTCTKCADACDAQAISFGPRTAEAPTPSNNPGILKWPINPEKCLRFWRENGCSCSSCIAACPYFSRSSPA